MITYPDGYGTRRITLGEMRARHQRNMHPEFARRFFAYIESKDGLLGVGGGFRITQPSGPGFAPDGKSFHQMQTWASGRKAYAAVDLVVGVPGAVHRAPTWEECADAPDYSLHTFMSGEPWHIQPIEIRGWQTWVNEGRKDPERATLPSDPEPEPPKPQLPQPSGEDMEYIMKPVFAGTTADTPWLAVFGSGSVRRAVNSDVRFAELKDLPIIDQDSQEQHAYLCQKFDV
jgi:hypothetical protein